MIPNPNPTKEIMKSELFELPKTLDLVVTGDVQRGNLDLFKNAIISGLQTINLKPSTDVEFGEANETVKKLAEVESLISNAKDEALKQAADLQSLFKELDETNEEVRQARLTLDKVVKAETAKRKSEIIEAGMETVTAVSSEHYRNRVTEAIKGKRTLKSMTEAVDKEVIVINAEVANARTIIAKFTDQHGDKIALDKNRLELMNHEALNIELQSRIDRLAAEAEKKKAQEEAAVARADAEQAKADAAPKHEADPLPKPQKVGNIRTSGGSSGPSADEEWKLFTQDIFAAFGGLKDKRAMLKHSSNIEKSTKFAGLVNEAWKAVNS